MSDDVTARRSLSVSQFGPLYHGTSEPGLTELDARVHGVRYPGMGVSYPYNFATTNLWQARDYAEAAVAYDMRHGGSREGKRPTVYELAPTRSAAWEPDPHSGWPRTRREALDWHEGGSQVSIRLPNPVKIRREVPPDEVEDWRPADDIPDRKDG